MELLVKNAANLLKVKTFVTFAVIAVYAALAFRGDIQAASVENLTQMVLVFYFGTQAAKKEG